MVGLLDKSVGLDDVKAQAAVRETEIHRSDCCKRNRSWFVSIIAGKLKGKNIISGKQYQLTPEKYQSKNSAFSRTAQPWCAERVVKQLRIDMEQHTKEWQNNPMLEGELILFLDATNPRLEFDEIRLFYDEKKGLEWEVEKCDDKNIIY